MKLKDLTRQNFILEDDDKCFVNNEMDGFT